MAVTAVVLFLVAVAQVSVIDWLAHSKVPRPLRGIARRLAQWHAARRPAPVALPPVLFELELRRLGAEVTRALDADQPAKAARVAAARAAYDTVLIDYGRSVGIEVPGTTGRVPLGAQDRFAVEEALVGAGYPL